MARVVDRVRGREQKEEMDSLRAKQVAARQRLAHAEEEERANVWGFFNDMTSGSQGGKEDAAYQSLFYKTKEMEAEVKRRFAAQRTDLAKRQERERQALEGLPLITPPHPRKQEQSEQARHPRPPSSASTTTAASTGSSSGRGRKRKEADATGVTVLQRGLGNVKGGGKGGGGRGGGGATSRKDHEDEAAPQDKGKKQQKKKRGPGRPPRQRAPSISSEASSSADLFYSSAPSTPRSVSSAGSVA